VVPDFPAEKNEIPNGFYNRPEIIACIMKNLVSRKWRDFLSQRHVIADDGK
jgi:hypothetical protein